MQDVLGRIKGEEIVVICENSSIHGDSASCIMLMRGLVILLRMDYVRNDFKGDALACVNLIGRKIIEQWTSKP